VNLEHARAGVRNGPRRLDRDRFPIKGVSINASVTCKAHQRAKLERLCRYMAHDPIALERLSVDADGLVVLELKRPFRDGTTQILFEPMDFVARLAALAAR